MGERDEILHHLDPGLRDSVRSGEIFGLPHNSTNRDNEEAAASDCMGASWHHLVLFPDHLCWHFVILSACGSSMVATVDPKR